MRICTDLKILCIMRGEYSQTQHSRCRPLKRLRYRRKEKGPPKDGKRKVRVVGKQWTHGS